jgi:hypothetical protein
MTYMLANTTTGACTQDCAEGRACPVRLGLARSCDELGVCQSVTKPCPPHTMCARKNSPFYFAPGAIDGGSSSDLGMQPDAGWLLDLRWYDWLGAVAILVIVGAIAGAAW